MKKRLIRYAILACGGVVLLAIAISIIVWRMGSGTIQDWIGVQIQDIANAYLNPHLTFTDLSYQYPLTVSLKNLHLTADDPKRPGHTIDIIACNHAVLSLAEIPSRGKPIVIEKIVLDDPLITAEAIEPRSKKFVGFSDLIRGASDQTSSSGEKQPEGKMKLSDVFRMRLVQLVDGKIVYDPRIPGTVPMSLDKINTTLNITPTDVGWYKLDTVIAREPVFQINLNGELNLDQFSTRNLDVKVAADLGRDKLDYLPPELQELLKQYEARGKLNLEVTGAVPMTDPLNGNLKAKVSLDGANIALSGLRIPVDKLDLSAAFADGKATLDALKISALKGVANLSGSVLLNDRLDAVLKLNVADMVPEKLLANTALASAAPARLNLDFNLAASLKSLLGKAPAKAGEPLAAIALKNFRLSAADPLHPGKDVDVVACKNFQVAMSHPLLAGKPIIIDKISLDEPVVNAIAVTPGSMSFVGMPNFPAPAPSLPKSQRPATAPSVADAVGQSLTDKLQVKTFQLNGARITYNPRIVGTVPMVIDAINTSLNASADDPGEYAIHTLISRQPAFSLAIDGDINIDHPGLKNLGLDLEADLTRKNLDFLPPQLQVLVSRSRAGGRLSLKSTATVALSDPTKSHAQVDLHMQGFALHQGSLDLPVDDVSLSATLQDGKVVESARVSALKNVFEMTGSATLNRRLDADLTVKLKDVEIEKLLALIDPSRPALTTSTKLNAEVEVQSPVMVALGLVPPAGNEPVASVAVHGLQLETSDPTAPGKPLDFLTCDELTTAVSSLPLPGKPAVIDQVVIKHPAVRAIAVEPGSNAYAGFAALQAMAKSDRVSGVGSRVSEEKAPERIPPRNPKPDTQPSPKPSDLVRLNSLTVADASLFYNPRIDGTVPMSIDHVTTQVNLDSPAGDAYRFDVKIPNNVDLSGDVSGRVNVDALRVDPLKLALKVGYGKSVPSYLPPQVQQLLHPYNLSANLSLDATASASLHDLDGVDLAADLKIDDLGATFGDYRIPIAHIRVPIHFKDGQLTILKSDSLGGPMIEAFDGDVNVTGTIDLNDRLDSNLGIIIDGLRLQDLAAAKITPPRQDLIGTVRATVNLVNAPLLVIAAKATPPSTQPSAPPRSPLASEPLPDHWGSAAIEITHARLAGLELIQGISNLAKSVFVDMFKHDSDADPQTIVPKESAAVLCDFNKDHVDCSKIHYEGEVIAADGKGYITLEQGMNLDITGGPMSKLGGMGAVGNWIKNASDSLLYYHIFGTFKNYDFEVKRGNGQPIVKTVKKVTDVAGNGIKTGFHEAHHFFDGLFHHGDQDQNQNQGQNSGQDQNHN